MTTSEPAEATVLIKSGEVDAAVPQFIDLSLWRVSPDIDAATLEQEVRTAVDEVLSNQKVTVGSVNVVDADPAAVEQFAVTQLDDMTDVCTAMTDAVGENRSLDLAILKALEADGDQLLGLSSGLPGSSPAPGVQKTCTVAVTDGASIDVLGSTIVHEGSHFMGLTHTTEADASSFDDFADTGECPASADQNGDGQVDDAECGEEGGANNYMFWLGNETFPQTDLSADQA